jgi:transaldolase
MTAIITMVRINVITVPADSGGELARRPRPVRAACDVLSPVYRQTAAKDGRVSIEVD